MACRNRVTEDLTPPASTSGKLSPWNNHLRREKPAWEGREQVAAMAPIVNNIELTLHVVGALVRHLGLD